MVDREGNVVKRYAPTVEPKDMEKDIISTGNVELDNLLGCGIRRKEITLIAGRPGAGKTLLLFDIEALNLTFSLIKKENTTGSFELIEL